MTNLWGLSMKPRKTFGLKSALLSQYHSHVSSRSRRILDHAACCVDTFSTFYRQSRCPLGRYPQVLWCFKPTFMRDFPTSLQLLYVKRCKSDIQSQTKILIVHKWPHRLVGERMGRGGGGGGASGMCFLGREYRSVHPHLSRTVPHLAGRCGLLKVESYPCHM